jgi:glycosyltransferase involved in cell wall biosynthesis
VWRVSVRKREAMVKQQSSNPRTLIVIPCFNEENTIGTVILKSKKYSKNILVVDDGSKDETSDIAKRAGARVIVHKKNMGKGAAIKTGFQYALQNKYDYVVTIDGDGQHNPDEIPNILGSVMNNGHDISIGYRVGQQTEMPKWRKLGKRVLDYGTGLGNGGFITDSQCGFRAFNKRAITAITPKLNGNDFSVESEQLMRAHELDLKVVNTNVSCKYRDLDTSTINPASHGISVLQRVLWLIAERHPLAAIVLPGFIMVLIGLALGIHTLQIYNQTHIFLISYAILVSILLIIGAIGMFIGLMLNVLPGMIQRAKS